MSLRAFGLLAALLFAFASIADPASPVLKVRQLPRSEFDVEQRGAVSIAYELVVRNPSQQAVTLRKLTMKTMGRSPYLLKDEAVTLDQVIEAGGEATVTFSMWAYRKSSERGPRATVWVRGNATFESDGRAFVTKFSDSFHEPD
jgi:hypothetical protein